MLYTSFICSLVLKTAFGPCEEWQWTIVHTWYESCLWSSCSNWVHPGEVARQFWRHKLSIDDLRDLGGVSWLRTYHLLRYNRPSVNGKSNNKVSFQSLSLLLRPPKIHQNDIVSRSLKARLTHNHYVNYHWHTDIGNRCISTLIAKKWTGLYRAGKPLGQLSFQFRSFLVSSLTLKAGFH